MLRRFFLCIGAMLLGAHSASLSYAQDGTTPQFGIVPNGSYASYHVDTVNVMNGNVVMQIPLFSLPQLGKLSLGASVVANSTYWVPQYSCSPDGLNCEYSYTPATPTYPGLGAGFGFAVSDGWFGPTIVPNKMPSISRTPWITNCGYLGAECFSNYYSVNDSLGGAHSLYYDSTNISQLRTTDGSGYLFLSGTADPSRVDSPSPTAQTSSPVVVDAEGVRYTETGTGSSATLVVSDPDANQITYGHSSITDSVGRTIPLVPQATSSTAGCPNLSLPYQSLVGSAVWQVPGANNGNASYTICYTTISFHTCLFQEADCLGTGINWGDGNDDNHSLIWREAFGSRQVIQSIVLPNGTYWGFVYDAANPSDTNSIAYGTITKLIFPDGGSISYSFENVSLPCSAGQYPTPIATGRIVSDGAGHSYAWSYRDGVVTDPDGNDTVHGYDQGDPWTHLFACSAFLENSVKVYQGSSTSGGTLLQTTTTTYQTASAPDPIGTTLAYGNAMPISVKTTLNDIAASSTTTTTGYAGSFSATIPMCINQNNPGGTGVTCVPNGTGSVALSLAIPKQSTTTDYDSTTLKSTKTTFQWEGSSNYLAANLLNTPSTVITYSDAGQTNKSAQTTISYDEPSYIANSGVIAGHPTTTTQWNNGTATNGGLDVPTHTSWTSHGMVDHTVDGRGYTSAQYTYNYTANGSAYINLYPSSVKNALLQPTSYTWDGNTGQLASLTDPNSQTTNFTYDDTGRLVDIKYPATANGRGEAQACYTDLGGAICTKATAAPYSMWTQQISDAGPVISQQKFDGLGRAVGTSLTSDPSGADMADTFLDWNDRTSWVSNPYRANRQPGDPENGKTSFTYDALGRVLTRQALNSTGVGLGTQNWTYTGPVVDFKDETLRHWKRTYNALSALTQVLEPDPSVGTPSIETDYCYDSLGNMTAVMHGSCSSSTAIRKFSYDSFSHLTKACNPESLSPGTLCSDGSQPGTAYTYDGNGNIVTKTDMRGVVTTYGYDSLNRLTSKTYTGTNTSASAVAAATPAACYLYDTSPSGTAIAYATGRLTVEWTSFAGCAATPLASNFESRKLVLAYDAVGHPTKEEQCGPGHCTTAVPDPYAMSYSYDLAGALTSFNNGLKQSNAMTFFNSYDTAGRLTMVNAFTRWDDIQHPSTLFSAQSLSSYGPAANLQQWSLGAGISATRSYDARGRITGQVANGYH